MDCANGTLQDRLVKELRLEGISSIEAVDAFLSRFRGDGNRCLAKGPFRAKDLLCTHTRTTPHGKARRPTLTK